MAIDHGPIYCAVCEISVACLEGVRDRQGAVKVLCNDCAETHFLTVEPIDPGPPNEKSE